jgi:hypothetical protein
MKPVVKPGWRAAVTALLLPSCLACAIASADAALLTSNSTGDQKRTDGTTWKVTVTEIERQPRLSILRITHDGRLPSVGSSFFIACTVLSLARKRGFRFVAQLEDPGTMKIGFLDKLDDDPARMLGREFAGLPAGRKYDAEQFAPICDLSTRGEAAPGK